MGKILLWGLVAGSVLSSLSKPWIGALAYYTLALWFPQAIWPWIFAGSRISFYVAIGAILGFMLHFIKGKLELSILKNRQNYFLVILLIFFNLSHIFSPYKYDPTLRGNINPEMVVGVFNNEILFYFIAIILIDTVKKFHYLILVLMVVTVYYVYWANSQYFGGLMTSERLGGPSRSIYSDENAFAMIFVLGIPFLFYMGNYYKNKLIKYSLWFIIPWAWHAVFLAASRGGLVGTGVVSLFIAFRSKSKSLGFALLVGLVMAYMWQGGYLRERTRTTVKRADSNIEEPLNPRLVSWQVGMSMMYDHPIFGVGVSKFLQLFSRYSDTTIHVAHNTFIQFGAGSGIMAMLMYVLIIVNIYFNYLKEAKSRDSAIHPIFAASNEAIVCSLTGFFVCSIFLDLAIYEILYYLLGLSIIRQRLINSSQSL